MSELLAEVNRRIRDLAAKVDGHDSSAWEFVCECGGEGCSERVGLPLALYDDLKHADVELLAPGHPLRRSAYARAWPQFGTALVALRRFGWLAVFRLEPESRSRRPATSTPIGTSTSSPKRCAGGARRPKGESLPPSSTDSASQAVHAPGRNRTCDLALRRRALYPLSYRRGTIKCSSAPVS